LKIYCDGSARIITRPQIARSLTSAEEEVVRAKQRHDQRLRDHSERAAMTICVRCNGTGFAITPNDQDVQQQRLCSRCQGSGRAA
jgi:DnaJ-class molecular chaperone